MADRVAIAGGTRVLMRVLGATPAEPATPVPVLPEVETIGDITEENAEVAATPLSSKTMRYIAGLSEGAAMEMVLFLLTDDTRQRALKNARDKRLEVEITVQPDDTSLQYRFNWLPRVHTIRTGAGGDPKRRVVSGRINSAVIEEPNEHPDFEG